MSQKITTLIFDVDDTLYDVGSGFTAQRNGEVVQKYMVERLGFKTMEEANAVRNEYFERYHATGKALTVAQAEGKFPSNAPKFDVQDLSSYWAQNVDYELLGGKNTKLQKDLKDSPLNIVAFSNAPRIYVKRVLQELGVWESFGEDKLFAVDDVLPHCKPEREAFEKIFQRIGVMPEECIMVEDSMKNIKKAKELGMKTVLVKGLPTSEKAAGEQTKRGDAPDESDPAVDVTIEQACQLRDVLPGLWEIPAKFQAVG
mmetsp:Transcript_16901/g.25570  ORF Transcript_16901/g.25570 Transcript_16901/m.25570 type:complete len:257 (-) Transcript_16901:1341-2111(-)